MIRQQKKQLAQSFQSLNHRKYYILMSKNPIIICEGPDYAGKTTLTNTLLQKYRNHVYVHCAVTSNIFALHQTAITNGIGLSEDFAVIIDRLHYSELVYGPIFRNGVSYDVKKFDEHYSSKHFPNIYKILCLPPKEIVLDGFKKRAAQGGEMFDTVEKVYDEYAKNPLGWTIYDWTKDGKQPIDLERFRG